MRGRAAVRCLVALLALGSIAGCAAPAAAPEPPERKPLPANSQEAAERVREASREIVTMRGLASWYGAAFHGKPTASGEPYDMNDFTAAHPTLPFGTVVEVRSLTNGRKVQVRINDRGPYKGRRIIDLSRAAAQALGLLGVGINLVQVTVREPAPAQANPPSDATPEPQDPQR